jgi:hydantoinase/carbamoylase family amidase
LVDRARIAARLEALWEIAHGPGGGADRPAFSRREAEAMRTVAGWAAEAGLAPGLDRHGNLWALPPDWDGPLVSSGSHVDTVPDGGRYDGALGTVLGLELARELRAGTPGGTRPALLVCAAEEAPRFSAGTIGSRCLAGTLGEGALGELRDAAGVSAAQARAEYRELVDLPELEAPLDRLRAHAEVHIAQRRGLSTLGVVERVAAPHRLEIEVRGSAGHAGEVSMESRRDALAAAAEIILALERAAREEPAETVATVGTLSVEPGAVSVIPARVLLGVDARAIDKRSLTRLEDSLRAAIAEIAGRRGIDARVRELRGGDPVVLDAALARAALDAAGRRGIAAAATWSGAGHDAQHLAALAPTLLLFVPLRGGESHTPDEGADATDVEHAALVARDVLAAVAG